MALGGIARGVEDAATDPRFQRAAIAEISSTADRAGEALLNSVLCYG